MAWFAICPKDSRLTPDLELQNNALSHYSKTTWHRKDEAQNNLNSA